MKNILTAIFLILSILIIPGSVSATTFDLTAPSPPSGGFIRGQEIKFTVNINTEGKSILSTSIGMTYEAQYLEYVSTSPGNTFTTVSTDIQGGGKLIISGSSTAPYSGSGTYAYVTYKLIATSSGSTQLCALFNPETPTTQPTLPPGGGGQPTSPPGQPTYPPQPTALPETGESKQAAQGVILASLFFIIAAGGLFVFKKT